ncbi:tyrosine-type recombinase/integrase [Spirosoma sp. HMF4905]|uniref:Tyrosine-type recombinase/integrase n=1 Tax=Spirosoma arboris TaxID=2682092 RepID=A0A7K1SNN0_9BACT|nr:site-specific integrase [Spirosoma arboris]MVM35412.1 tyrosine-type recombinase/integrase [Spirosoma arboris]
MIKVKLRKKPITGGRTSLYLDYYPAIPHPDTGKPTRREFLGLYLFNRPKTPADKEQNNETVALAETIRAQRQIEVQSGAYGFLSKKTQNTCFVAYCEQLAASRTGSNKDGWDSALHYLKDFTGGSLKLSELTLKKCRDFRAYMMQAKSQRNDELLAVNSTVSYFNKFKAALKQAYKDGIISTDLDAKIEGIKPEETRREYLTLAELQLLVETDLHILPVLKQAALFSALTGLRYSDIEALTWKQIRYDADNGYTINFRQEKTDGVEYMPISNQAVSLLGERLGDSQPVLPGLMYSAHWNKILKQWVKAAGITKNVTFHSFRHTYATLQLSLGTDIYTVSKMLGHRELKTTQIYAKIIDQSKRDAADKIKLTF